MLSEEQIEKDMTELSQLLTSHFGDKQYLPEQAAAYCAMTMRMMEQTSILTEGLIEGFGLFCFDAFYKSAELKPEPKPENTQELKEESSHGNQ